MGELVRRNLRFFLLFSVAALLLRLIFIFYFPGVVTDSFVYGDIAKNWLQHGIYGLSGPDEISSTYIRLPGYPAFLAVMFAIFGMEHYRAVLFVQMFVDLGTCFLCADITRRLMNARAAKVGFALACLCPFLANYSAAALTETLEVFFTVLALDLAIGALQRQSLWGWAGCGAACAAAILLRPDGALVVIAIEVYVLWRFFVKKRERVAAGMHARQLLTTTVLVVGIAVLPLIPWAIRNWSVFQRFQPLAPRYANEENEFVPMGFNRWVKTWVADYTSVEEIYWSVPGSAIDVTKLPARAFDSLLQQTETAAAIDDYNNALHVSPELDAKFEVLAAQRIGAHRLRYYVGLPLLRIIDMWLRPRTEMLPCDSRWWEFNDDAKWLALALAMGVVNLLYVMCAFGGWIRGRTITFIGLPVLFFILRSGFLGTLENPEPRYTLEMYPVVIVFTAYAIGSFGRASSRVPAPQPEPRVEALG